MCAAVADYQLGVGALGTFNSQVLPTVRNAATTSGAASTEAGGVAGLNLAVTPWLTLTVDSGRISESLRLAGLFGADILLGGASVSTAPSYQGSVNSTTRMALTARLTWDLLVNGSIGTINAFTQLQNPATQQIEGVNLRAINSFNVGAGSNLGWEPTARLRLGQVLNFRAYVPFGDFQSDQVGVATQSATSALQSYNLDGGAGVDHQWARLSLGGELRFGWFLPQRGAATASATDDDRSVVTGQLLGRFGWDLAPRWRAEGNAGVFVATRASNFLEGERAVPVNASQPDGPTRTVNATLISPIGSLSVNYSFPRVEAGLGLSYAHGAAGEVVLGRITVSDAVTLRAFLPLPRQIVLSAGGGYRYARVAENGGLSTLPQRDPITMVVTNPAYHMFVADASLTWLARPGLQLFLRGGVMVQRFVRDDEPVSDPQTALANTTLQDFTRGLVSLGLAYVYPQR